MLGGIMTQDDSYPGAFDNDVLNFPQAQVKPLTETKQPQII